MILVFCKLAIMGCNNWNNKYGNPGTIGELKKVKVYQLPNWDDGVRLNSKGDNTAEQHDKIADTLDIQNISAQAR